MKKAFLIDRKRYIFYIVGLIVYPGFFRLFQNNIYIALLPLLLIGTAILFSLASNMFRNQDKETNKNNILLPQERELFVIKGSTKLKVTLECIQNQLTSLVKSPYQFAFGYQCSYSVTDRIEKITPAPESEKYEGSGGSSPKRIRKGTNELIFNFDNNGNVMFVTEEAVSMYGKKMEDFYGKNIKVLQNIFGIKNDEWFEALSSQYHVQSTAEFANDGKKMWVYWNFEAVTDANCEIEMIIGTGHEITNIINVGQIQDRSFDFHTGLLSQNGLQDKIAGFEGVEKAASFFVDLWNFSRINDYYGYSVGDQIILMIANELKSMQNDNCFISRFSGDKFVGFIINEGVDKFEEYLCKLRKFVTSMYQVQENLIQIDKRIGYALYPEDTGDLSKLVSMSSLAMKESKQENQFTIARYQKHMGETLKQNIITASKLKGALERREIEVHFQKTIDTRTLSFGYLEELARWVDPELGYVSPLVLFSVAKEFNLLDQLEKYLIEEAIRNFIGIRNNPDYIKTKLAINLAPSSFMDLNFLTFLNQVVDKCHLKHSDICIEVSESTFVNTLAECIFRINEYRKNGYVIALDDFGKDYSSLAILESVAFDIIKIDKLFIDKVFEKKNQEIVKMIRKIAELSNKEIIAEGVETNNQSIKLIELGCFIQQGYYFHRPEKMF